MKKKTLYGLLAALGISLAAGAAHPFVGVLNEHLSLGQIMFVRGIGTAIIVWIIMAERARVRGELIEKIPPKTWWIALAMPIATYSLYAGFLQEGWGAGLTIIIITATPLLNVVFSLGRGRKVSAMTMLGLVMILGGVWAAVPIGKFQWYGLVYSVIALIANAALYELFGCVKAKPLQKCFTGCVGMGVGGWFIIFHNKTPLPLSMTLELFWMIVGFVIVGGFLYWLCNAIAFTCLSVPNASVLAQAETPFVLVGAWLMLGEKLTPFQMCGAGVMIAGAALLSRWLALKDDQTPQSSPVAIAAQ